MENIINEIKNKIDLAEIVGEYVPLKKRGRNFLALCPFHSEKTPSFTVSPEKQIWHCFGCGQGGNLFDFLIKIEKIDFAEALEILAKRAGLKFERAQYRASRKTGEVSKKVYQLLNEAAEFFQTFLHSPSGKEALNYLNNRKLSAETLKKFGLGLAPFEGDRLFREFTRRGWSPASLVETGLALKGESGNYYDRFRGRIIFPVFDIRGRVVAFGGRVFGENQEPKYLNSPETPVYVKGEHLYGLNLAQEKIRRLDEVIVVEGYLDLISLHQAGFDNAIAALGTAFTPFQAKLLARFTKNILIAFDLDPAGILASLRSFEILTELGLKPKVINLTPYKDPDELIRAEGSAKFGQAKEKAISWLEFAINIIIGKFSLNTIEGKSDAAEELVNFLSKIKDSILQTGYAKKAAGLIGVEENSLISRINQKKYQEEHKAMGKEKFALKRSFSLQPLARQKEAEKILIRLALENKKFSQLLKESIGPDFFKDEALNKIAHLIWEKPLDVEILEFTAGHKEEASLKNLITSLLLESDFVLDKEKAFYDCLDLLKKHEHSGFQKELLKQINQAEKEGAFDKANELKKVYCQQLETFKGRAKE